MLVGNNTRRIHPVANRSLLLASLNGHIITVRRPVINRTVSRFAELHHITRMEASPSFCSVPVSQYLPAKNGSATLD